MMMVVQKMSITLGRHSKVQDACVMYRCNHMYVPSKRAGASCSNVLQHGCYSTAGELCWLNELHTELRLLSPCKGGLSYSTVQAAVQCMCAVRHANDLYVLDVTCNA